MGNEDQPTDEIEGPGARAGTAVADGPLLASGKRLGERYRLERPLGHGGMAAVWLATDERLDRQVAIKVLSDTLAHDRGYLDRFRREAHVAAGLQHPNLVSVYDYGAGDRPYLVMEYIPGGDLAERVEARTAPEPEPLAGELLAALRHIHAAGVLHRDIKPQNVLIDAAGHARLTDFGIAQPRDATALTKTGHVIGTERYLAPEVKEGAPASERADLFALGVVLADLPSERAGTGLRELADRLRDPDPEQRPQSAAAALATLERQVRTPVVPATATQPYEVGREPEPEPIAEAATPPTRPFKPSPTGVRQPGNRRTAIGLIAVGLAVVALVVALALGGGGDDGSGVDVRESDQQAQGGGDGGGGGSAPADTTTEAPADTSEPATDSTSKPEPAADSGGAGVDGEALNQEGYDLLQAGDPEGAIPPLEQAVAALEGSGSDTYYYALYNLGDALVQAGRPEEAIPYLQERLEFDDGQLGTVQAKLDEAEAAAGVAPADDKPGQGPKGEKSPPPFEDED